MLNRDPINEEFLMSQIYQLIKDEPLMQVMALTMSSLGLIAMQSPDPKQTLLLIAKHFLELSKRFNKDGTMKKIEELEK
jgi:hypothetical protein